MYAPLVENGAQIILVPSAFTVPTGAAHWHTLLKGEHAQKQNASIRAILNLYHLLFCSLSARAIESQCYVLAAAQYGRHNVKRESFGHSLAVDPWGKILADAGGYPLDGPDSSSLPEPEDAPTIITCEIDLEQVEAVRQRMPIEMHRSSASFSF